MILNLNLPSIIILIIIITCVIAQLITYIRKRNRGDKCCHCSCSNCTLNCENDYLLKTVNKRNVKEVEEFLNEFVINDSFYKNCFCDSNDKLLIFEERTNKKIIGIINIKSNNIYFIIRSNEKNKENEIRLLKQLLFYLKKKKFKNVYIYSENNSTESSLLNCNCALESVELFKDGELYLKRFSIKL